MKYKYGDLIVIHDDIDHCIRQRAQSKKNESPLSEVVIRSGSLKILQSI